ncbi:hypothetical protein HYPSUDRAFT_1041007 [Hypholoma sublateritium FD-334 SS-4]|uniref:Uncharacterized protein n=1 Tax=Hypholoma sublateritium (strain FD-334 SS-4) TaxID=945553 RepID=A0A0D2NKX5_HYPSF|nr:hypothetical protein HYPSUDRAFT_1041007 [Hypholoma sublateritium FD-334 SS-4]
MQPSGDGRQGYQPSPQPPMPYHAWNEIQHDSGIIEKDPYMAVGDILSHIGNTTDSHVLQTAVSSEYLHVLRTALSSGEVGRLAILSNPEAQDNLIRAALKECQLAAEGPDPQETVFEVLMETLSIFETAPNDHEKAEVHVAGLLTVLEAFLKLDPPLNSIPSTRYTRLKDTIM